MKTISILIKDKSSVEFFRKNFSEFKENDNSVYNDNSTSIYHLMKDEIILKKSDEFEIESIIIFELKDMSRNSNKELRNIYKYKVSKYDSISVKLTLLEFNILTLN